MDVLERLDNKLLGWRQRALSMAGRMTLVKVVAEAIPTFAMQVILFPKHMLDKMDKKI